MIKRHVTRLTLALSVSSVSACTVGEPDATEEDSNVISTTTGGTTGGVSASSGGADGSDQTMAGGAPVMNPGVDPAGGSDPGTPSGSGGTPAEATCSDGVLNDAGTVCCAAACGTCGGSGCGDRPGGASDCCAGPILTAGVSCSSGSAPCVVGEVDDPVDPGSDPDGYQPTSPSCKLVLDEDFSGYSGGYETYTQAKMESDFDDTSGPYKGLDGRTKVGESSIRAFFPKGVVLGQDTGFTWFSNLPDGVEEAIFSYDVFFEENFDWTKGGKLPGLCGGTCPRGCTNDVDNGFSMRLMWQREAGMIVYPYWPAQSGDQHCGGAWHFSDKAIDGKWHEIRQHIRLNDPDKQNGTIRMYMDGKLVQQRSDIRYRTSNSVTIDKAYITTYVGGKSVEDFAPDHDQYIWFDSFKVWIDCDE